MSDREPHSDGLICYMSRSSDTFLNADAAHTFWKHPIKITGKLKPLL